MPKIFAFGDCNCDEWNEHAQDISDRIVSSLKIKAGNANGYDMYQGVQFRFCPYCGRKLVQAGAGYKNVGMWAGKSLLTLSHSELIDIINQMGENLHKLQEDLSERLEAMRYGLGGP